MMCISQQQRVCKISGKWTRNKLKKKGVAGVRDLGYGDFEIWRFKRRQEWKKSQNRAIPKSAIKKAGDKHQLFWF
jgi:hypothetical protein